MLRAVWTLVWLGALVGLCAVPGQAQRLPNQQEVLRTTHFEIQYDRVGSDAVSQEFVDTVRNGLEEAYAVLIEGDGFRFPEGRVQIHLLGSFLGANTFGATFVPVQRRNAVIVFNNEQVFQSGASFLNESLNLTTSSAQFVKSVAVHELFHVIQREYDFTETLLAESTAVWAAERVVPESNDYVFNAVDFLVGGTDHTSLLNLNPSYGLGLFWMSAAPRFGGPAFVRELLELAEAYDGLEVLERAFARHGTTFFEQWAGFALRLETRAIHDAPLVFAAAEAFSGATAPVAALETAWSGGLQSVRTLDGDSPLLDSPFGAFADALGDPLRVAHAFGTDFVRIRVAADGDLLLRFQGDASSAFRVSAVVTRAGAVDRVVALDGDEGKLLPALQAGDRVTVVVTRGLEGTGGYALYLAPGAPLFGSDATAGFKA